MMTRKLMMVTAFMLSLVLSGAPFDMTSLSEFDAGSAFFSGAHAAESDTCISDFRKDDEEEAAATGEEEEDDRDGLLTQIIDYIKEIIEETSQQLFLGITGNSGFVAAVNAAFALSIAMFGAAFMFGIVPLTFGQALTRGVKIAVIAGLMGFGGWTFFSTTVVEFFNDGTDDLIGKVISIATGEPYYSIGEPQPFKQLEEVVGGALSPEMMVSVMTAFTTGPMGPAVGGMLGIAIIAFIQMLVKAMRVYVISLVAKALLFGMAPIFISFILFERTKHIFTGWVNQLVNYSLQPLLLFAFLSFFVVLIESSLNNILSVDICWNSVSHQSGQTTMNSWWRYVDEDGNATGSDFTWEGLVDCIKANDGSGTCQDFPISILDILTFLILSHLAYRFSDVVVHIATEIASSTLFLDKLRSGLADTISKSEAGVTSGGRGRR